MSVLRHSFGYLCLAGYLTFANIGFAETFEGSSQLPNMGGDLTATNYEHNHSGSQLIESHSFFSDGTYCYSVGTHGFFGILGGHWQYENGGKEISVTPIAISNEVFGVWENDDYDDSELQEKRTLKLSEFTYYDVLDGEFLSNIIIGFGGLQPDAMTVFDPNIHEDVFDIPNHATHFFIGMINDFEQADNDSHHQLFRFALNTPLNEERANQFVIKKDFNMIDGRFLTEFQPIFDVVEQSDGKFALSVRDKSENKAMGVTIDFDSKDPIIQGDTNLDGYDAYDTYSYCKTGRPRLSLIWDENETNDTKLYIVDPQPIHWTGDLTDNLDWLKPINS